MNEHYELLQAGYCENVNIAGVSPPAANEPFLLVFGSEYDGQGVNGTLSKLVDAFPFMKIVALDAASHVSPRVVPIGSGSIDSSKIHSLIEGASAIIFPSYYDRFELPVVKALAHGKTVLVRGLAL